MNFNDLIFKPHPVKGVKGIHATLELKPNIHMSIVAGEGMYCTTKNGIKKAVSKVEDVVSFEVAIIDENVNEEDQEWEVLGWQSREDINKMLSEFYG
jgi:hypothetical protein|tara:strand:- start:41 stop:331 length:291 start_codon:yes stop_codon:yes gene_type:complete